MIEYRFLNKTDNPAATRAQLEEQIEGLERVHSRLTKDDPGNRLSGVEAQWKAATEALDALPDEMQIVAEAADARAQVVEAMKAQAIQVKAKNEIAQAAAKASSVEGVTPETVMLQDPDAVLAVLDEKQQEAQ